MKHLTRFLILICLLLPSVVLAYPTDRQEAVEAVKQHFAGRDIDIYGVDSNSPSYWSLFVDAEPAERQKQGIHVFARSNSPPERTCRAMSHHHRKRLTFGIL